jgi:hypothetical protein
MQKHVKDYLSVHHQDYLDSQEMQPAWIFIKHTVDMTNKKSAETT